MQQEAIVHIVSILNITLYVAQVNRQHINIIMDRVDNMVHDVNNLYNITTSLSTTELLSISTSHQICLSKRLGFTISYQSSLHAYHRLH